MTTVRAPAKPPVKLVTFSSKTLELAIFNSFNQTGMSETTQALMKLYIYYARGNTFKLINGLLKQQVVTHAQVTGSIALVDQEAAKNIRKVKSDPGPLAADKKPEEKKLQRSETFSNSKETRANRPF